MSIARLRTSPARAAAMNAALGEYDMADKADICVHQSSFERLLYACTGKVIYDGRIPCCHLRFLDR